ncbi:MAG: hypothetical protein ACP5H2_05450 [Solirubrobacteraceae bacterium]
MHEPTNPESPVPDAEDTQIMNPVAPQTAAGERFYDDDYDDEPTAEVSIRPRMRFLSPLTAALITLVGGGVGFFIGVRVEKANGGGSSSAGAGASAFARGLSSGRTSTSATASRSGAFGGGAFATLFGGGGGARAGSVTAVDGRTLYVRESSGNTVKVKVTGNTTVTKSESVSSKKIYPGDEVTVTGAAGKGGTVTATAVSDSGSSGSASSSAGASSSGTGASTSSTGATSAIAQLFGR